MSLGIELCIVFLLIFSLFVIFDARDRFDRIAGSILLALYLILTIIIFIF